MLKRLFTVWIFVKINTKRFFRDQLAIFFTVVFPLIFLFVFGSFTSGSGAPSYKVALINESQSNFAKNFVTQAKSSGIFKVSDDGTTIDKAKELMSKSQLDGAIVLPSDFG